MTTTNQWIADTRTRSFSCLFIQWYLSLAGSSSTSWPVSLPTHFLSCLFLSFTRTQPQIWMNRPKMMANTSFLAHYRLSRDSIFLSTRTSVSSQLLLNCDQMLSSLAAHLVWMRSKYRKPHELFIRFSLKDLESSISFDSCFCKA